MTTIGRLRTAVFGRFLPACGSFFLAVLTFEAFRNPRDISGSVLAIAIGELTLLTLGFAASVSIISDRLATVPRLGIRCLAAGLLSPLILLVATAFTQGASIPTLALVSFVAGAATGGGFLASVLLRREKRADPALVEATRLLEADLAERSLGQTPVRQHQLDVQER